MNARGTAVFGKEIAAAELRGLMANVPTSVAVVAGFEDEAPVGLTVGTFVSVSLEPPLISICVGRSSQSWPKIKPAGRFSISVLGADQHEVCAAFASREPDKFRTVDWTTSEAGLPWIKGSLAYLDCVIEKEVSAGDHEIVLGRVVSLYAGDQERPLIFHARRLGSMHYDD